MEKAIKMALEYEAGIHAIYKDAMEKTADPRAKRVFRVLCEEELEHVKYLQERLSEWQKSGRINVKILKTSIPARAVIEKALQDVRQTVEPKHTKQIPELELLKKALEAEMQTSAFYREMVSKLDGEGQALFKRFVEIEEGHETIVRAEINTAGNWGFWFDTPEFRLEME